MFMQFSNGRVHVSDILDLEVVPQFNKSGKEYFCVNLYFIGKDSKGSFESEQYPTMELANKRVQEIKFNCSI